MRVQCPPKTSENSMHIEIHYIFHKLHNTTTTPLTENITLEHVFGILICIHNQLTGQESRTTITCALPHYIILSRICAQFIAIALAIRLFNETIQNEILKLYQPRGSKPVMAGNAAPGVLDRMPRKVILPIVYFEFKCNFNSCAHYSTFIAWDHYPTINDNSVFLTTE